jgi:osomolarity two-component system sensor histidine kinase SLN1
MESGMDFFLSKPIRRPALKHVLKTYCPPIVEEDEAGEKTPPKNSPNPAAPAPINTGTLQAKGPFSTKAGPSEHVESPAISPGTT